MQVVGKRTGRETTSCGGYGFVSYVFTSLRAVHSLLPGVMFGFAGVKQIQSVLKSLVTAEGQVLLASAPHSPGAGGLLHPSICHSLCFRQAAFLEGFESFHLSPLLSVVNQKWDSSPCPSAAICQGDRGRQPSPGGTAAPAANTVSSHITLILRVCSW